MAYQRERVKRYAKTPKGRELKRRKRLRAYALGKDRRTTWADRTPKWINKDEIIEFIKSRPDGFHLDHIVPLRGANVCGLHVVENLQFIPADQNIRKSNKVIPETLEAAVCLLDIDAALDDLDK